MVIAYHAKGAQHHINSTLF